MTATPQTLSAPPATAPEAPASPTTMQRGGTLSLRRGEIETAVSPRIAKAMAVLFLLGIFAVPTVQTVYEVVKQGRVQALDVVKPGMKSAGLLAQGHVRESALTAKAWLTKETLASFERGLEEASLFRARIQPRVQGALTRHAGFGNSMVIPGPEGWLYYQLGMNYVGGPGFLERDLIKRREAALFAEGEDDVNADPRPAVVRFHEDCRAAGVHLVFVPVPVKEMIESRRSGGAGGVLNNRDYAKFVSDLRASGVDVFDSFIPTKRSEDDEPRYLRTDTHWTPAWMEAVARQLVGHVQGKVEFGPAPAGWETKAEAASVAHVGDLVETLKLHPRQKLFPAQSVEIHRILDVKTGEPLASREDADVLFIGDSFSNIYSRPEMKWGDSAGLPFQTAHLLKRPVEMLLKNGAAATELREELARRVEPLKGKKVVVWQVAMHELSCSNWKVIPIGR